LFENRKKENEKRAGGGDNFVSICGVIRLRLKPCRAAVVEPQLESCGYLNVWAI